MLQVHLSYLKHSKIWSWIGMGHSTPVTVSRTTSLFWKNSFPIHRWIQMWKAHPHVFKGFTVFDNTHGRGNFVFDFLGWLKLLHICVPGLKTQCHWIRKKSTYRATPDNRCSRKLWTCHSSNPVMHCVQWLLSHSHGLYFRSFQLCLKCDDCKHFLCLIFISRLCFILLKLVTLSLFTLYSVWQCFEIKHWLLNLINKTIFPLKHNASLKL